MPAIRRGFRQFGQITELNERSDPQNGVMPPEISGKQMPIVRAGGENRGIKPYGELLDSSEKSPAEHLIRQSLNDPHTRSALHHGDESGNKTCGHDAVRIQSHHIPVVGAPPSAEIRQISALPMARGAALAIMDPAPPSGSPTKIEPPPFLCDPVFRAVGVTEKKDVELVTPPCGLQVVPKGFCHGKDRTGILVVHRQDEGRSDGRGPRWKDGSGPPHPDLLCGKKLRPPPQHRQPESGHDLVKKKGKENELGDFQAGKPLPGKGSRQKPHSEAGAGQNSPEETRPPKSHRLGGDFFQKNSRLHNGALGANQRRRIRKIAVQMTKA